MPTNLKDAAKTNTRASRFFVLLALSLLFVSLSLCYVSTIFLPASELGVIEINDSDYRWSVAWGAPFFTIIDMLDSEKLNFVDAKDDFSSGAFFANWMFYLALSWPLSFIMRTFFRFCVRFVQEVARPNAEN